MGERLGLSGRGFVGGFCDSESNLLKEPIAGTYCWDLLLELITETYYWNSLQEIFALVYLDINCSFSLIV